MSLPDPRLWPFALPYEGWVRLRAAAYRHNLLRPKRLEAKVISVGNLTTGGTGKTPLVLWLAERLLAEGKNAAILTRGYRGKRATEVVSRSGASAPVFEAGASDEVQLLRARLGDRVSFGIGANRFARGQELVRRGVEWFVLDDGFQHLQLARDADIVLVDALNPFGGGRLLPAGHLREPKSALARADVVVITRSFHAPAVEAAILRDSSAPIFHARAALQSIHNFREGYPGATDERARGRKYFAFCGIGNASAFLSDLREWGFQAVGHRVFRDHHRYSQSDVNQIEAQARSVDADALLCTEKDVFNLAGVQWGPLDPMYCRISLGIDREADFWRTVQESIRKQPAVRRGH